MNYPARGEIIPAEIFRDMVKRARRVGETQTAFAARLEVSVQFLNKVLAGQVNPGPQIAAALGYKQVFGYILHSQDHVLPQDLIERKKDGRDKNKTHLRRHQTKPKPRR